MSNHAVLSPSSAHRWMKCPASVVLSKDIPDERNERAVDGTHSHTLLEHCLRPMTLGLGPIDPMLTIGKSFSDHDGEFTVDVERAKRVLVGVNYVRDTINGRRLLIEQCLNAGGEMIAGTADIIMYDDESIEVVDYKDGSWFVDPTENQQLMIYGWHAKIQLSGALIRTIKLTIVQPRNADKGFDAINSWSTDEQLMQEWFKQELNPAVTAASEMLDGKREAVPTPGESQCHWCRAGKAGKCTAANSTLVTIAPEAPMPTVNLTPEAMAVVVNMKKVIIERIEAVEAELLRRWEAGGELPEEVKVVRGRGSRSWRYDDETMEKKFKSLGLPKASCYTQKLLSPAQFPKVTWTKRGGEETHSIDPTQWERLQKEWVDTSEGAVKVVAASSRGKAISPPRIEDQFADVEVEE